MNSTSNEYYEDEKKNTLALSNVNSKIALLEQTVGGITARLDEIINTLKGTLDVPGYRARIEFLEKDLKIANMELAAIKYKIDNSDITQGAMAVRLTSVLERVEAKFNI